MTEEYLEETYSRLNRREYVSPDPLQFLYEYPDLPDREIVGFIASSLAYGRVWQILRAVEDLLGTLGPSPYSTLIDFNRDELSGLLGDFRYRFVSGDDIIHAFLVIIYFMFFTVYFTDVSG